MFSFKQQKLALPAAAALLGIAMGSTNAWAQKAITLGTSSIGSSFYVVSVGMAKMALKHANINLAVESVGGSHANMFALQRGKIDFAIANSGAAYDRFHGNKPFKKPFEIRLVSQGHPTLRWFMARKGAGIRTPKDIEGKTISSIRRSLPELKVGMEGLIKAFNLDRTKIKQVASSNTAELSRQLRSGSIHGAFAPFSPRQPAFSKLFRDDKVEPLILSDADYAKLKAVLPDMFYKFVVKANNFKNQPTAFPVLGLNALLTTSAKMDDDTVYNLLKSFMGHQKEFRKFHGAAKYWNPKRAVKNPKIPFHNGAIRYYKEAGIWNAKLDALQAKLLKR